MARQSPMAICMVVEVVGAMPCGHASFACGSTSTTSAWRASVELAREVMATSGTLNRRE